MRAASPRPVPVDSATFQLPLIATPAATGFTQPTTDYVEAGIDFNRLIYRHPAATYVMRVAHDAALPPQPGDLVVAQIEDAFLLCRFERQQGDIHLIPENRGYKPVTVTEEMEPGCIFGTVSYILHRPKRRKR